MKKEDLEKLKPIYRSIIHQVKDPPRYPNVINGYESKMKRSYELEMNKMVANLTKQMVNFLK